MIVICDAKFFPSEPSNDVLQTDAKSYLWNWQIVRVIGPVIFVNVPNIRDHGGRGPCAQLRLGVGVDAHVALTAPAGGVAAPTRK